MSHDIPSADPNQEHIGSKQTDTTENNQTTGAAAKMASTAPTYGEKIVEAATQAKDYVSGTVATVGERIREIEAPSFDDLKQRTQDYIKQNPGWSIVFAATIGFLLARWLTPRQPLEGAPRIEPLVEKPSRVQRETSLELQPAKQYVISSPSGFHLASGRYRNQLKSLALNKPVQILDSIQDDADKLALLTDTDIEKLRATLPGLIVEPNILYKTSRHPMFESFQIINLSSGGATKRIRIGVYDEETGNGIEGATVRVLEETNPPTGYEAITNSAGNCDLIVPNSLLRYAALIVLPRYGYWTRLIRDVSLDGSNNVSLGRLPSSKSALYDWGHQFADMSDELSLNAEDVKIGVIDTGIIKGHPGIVPTGGYNCIYGEIPSMWDRDLDGHGTHVAGIIAATVSKSGKGTKGYVPQAKILAYRAVGEGGAFTYDLAKAIHKAVEDGCDIINMSLGSPSLQIAIRNKTEMAYDHGVLCIAATGNDGGSVNYPAAFNSVMGVGAFGKFGAYPNNSLHATAETDIRSANGDYYFAKFSNFGDGVDFCAPGVAILSTVPGGDYSAWDGTSMACPQVTGLAALALAAHKDIFTAPRDADRVERLIRTLKNRTRKLNFGPMYEGTGYLTVPTVLVA